MRTVADIPHMNIYQNPDLSSVIPEPDYSDSEEWSRQGRANRLAMTSDVTSPVPRGLTQQLHRELAFNQKIGKNLLGQKSELQRAMERHRDQQQRRQMQDKLHSNRSSFEIALEERLLRAEPKTRPADDQLTADGTPEFLRVHARMRSKVNAPS